MKVSCILLVVSMMIMISGTVAVLGPEYTFVDWAKCRPQIHACYKPGLSYSEVVESQCHKDAMQLPECQSKEPDSDSARSHVGDGGPQNFE